MKPSEQFINQLVESASERSYLYSVHKTHEHRAIAGNQEQTAILSSQHTV